MTRIKRVDAAEAREYIKALSLTKEEVWAMDYCFTMSMFIWVGLINGALACIWGLIPPSLMSNQAYLWLYTTNVIEGHSFLLVRHSQLVMEEMLEEYPSICGHAIAGADRSIKWLKWLGAKFGEPDGKNIPFRIKRNG